MVAYATSYINVVPFERSSLDNGAPYWDLVDNRIYNGAAFDGFVKRPRTQAGGAVNYFTTLMGNTHSFKVGLDWQSFNSENSFRFPNNQLFYGFNFDPAARAFAQTIRARTTTTRRRSPRAGAGDLPSGQVPARTETERRGGSAHRAPVG